MAALLFSGYVPADRRHIARFTDENTIISVASDYGGNVLMGKKCLALRIGSHLGHKGGCFYKAPTL